MRNVGHAHDFGEPSLVGTPVHVHLPESVLRLHVSLREEQVVDVPRVDVRHAPSVANDLDAVAQAAERDASVDLRER